MRSGYIVKSGEIEKNTAEEMDLVNKYTRRKFDEADVYIFSIVLCDNEIDRDYEMFTKEALESLATLFVGKTGIMNHDMKAENQTARTISCNVTKDESRVNSLGDPYYKLEARAYMPRTDKNKDFITEIDSGIKKEVSVSCSVDEMICSICSKNLKKTKCNHKKGVDYVINGRNESCFYVLNKPKDVYEWSFVAVPAQKEAGVIKAFSDEKREGFTMTDILKQLELGEEITLNQDQTNKLHDLISSLKKEAEDGKAYKEDLEREVIRLCVASDIGISIDTMKSVAGKMSLQELKSFKDTFEKKSMGIFNPKPQLIPQKHGKIPKNNIEFKI